MFVSFIFQHFEVLSFLLAFHHISWLFEEYQKHKLIVVNQSGFHGSFRQDLECAQAISQECKSAFVINVHNRPKSIGNAFSFGSETQANKIIKRLKPLQENQGGIHVKLTPDIRQ